MKIAIIGSGISGLVAAYHLHRDNDVTVFEANDYIGGHTNTASVNLEGNSYAVDTGFIVFNDWTYPKFIQLLDELKVESQATEMSFSVRDEASGVEYNGHSLNTLFAQRKNLFRPQFYRMVFDILRFNRQAKSFDVQTSSDDERLDVTVGEFLDRNKYSNVFRTHYLLPMGAAIWSCPTGTFAEFPIRFVIDFYRNHGLLNIGNRPTWRVVSGGSKTYVSALTAGFKDNIRLNSPVSGVVRSTDGVTVSTSGGNETFDHVIFACHSDQALRILGDDATETETSVLSAFPYTKNSVVLHTDESLLPANRLAWASWNYLVGEENDSSATVTYDMNILQQIDSPQTFCVTLNGESKIAPDRILAKYEYDHPVFTLDRAAAQGRHRELLNVNKSSFCGAYWGNGFHEDGVVSALTVVNAINAHPAFGAAAIKASSDTINKSIDDTVDLPFQGTRP
jgi:predicted NAD/FAD-binding protein